MEATLASGDCRLPRTIGEEPLHEHLLRARHQCFVSGKVDVLPHAGHTYRTMRGQGAHGHVESDRVVALVAVSRERWSAGVAGNGSRPGEGVGDEVVGAKAGVRPMQTHGRDGDPHERRIGFFKVGRRDRGLRSVPIFDEDIGTGDEFQERLLILGGVQVERKQAFSGVIPGRLDRNSRLPEKRWLAVERVA